MLQEINRGLSHARPLQWHDDGLCARREAGTAVEDRAARIELVARRSDAARLVAEADVGRRQNALGSRRLQAYCSTDVRAARPAADIVSGGGAVGHRRDGLSLRGGGTGLAPDVRDVGVGRGEPSEHFGLAEDGRATLQERQEKCERLRGACYDSDAQESGSRRPER